MVSDNVDIVDLWIEEENMVKYNIMPDRERTFIQSFMDVQQQQVEATKAMPEAMTEVGGALAKGSISGTLGAPADLIALATGLLNMLTDDPEEKGNLMQFAEGFDTVPFTSEKINQFLTSLGWKEYEGPAEGVELLGEIAAPTKVAETVAKKIIKKAVK